MKAKPRYMLISEVHETRVHLLYELQLNGRYVVVWFKSDNNHSWVSLDSCRFKSVCYSKLCKRSLKNKFKYDTKEELFAEHFELFL
jgi:hypothetical protein